MRQPLHLPGNAVPYPHEMIASASPVSAHQRRFAAAHAVLKQAVRDRAFPGAAYGILLNSEILALDAVGRFTYDSDAPPVTPSTVFDLASVTKVVATTAIAMLLHDRGLLSLETPLSEILLEFAAGSAPNSDRRSVTLRHLLAHSSGLPGYLRLFEQHRSPAAMLDALLHVPLEAAPGTRAEYSDIGFMLLGRALEVLAGEDLSNIFQTQIAAPLRIETARFTPPAEWRNQIPPTEDDTTFRHRVIQGEVQDENCFVLGGIAGHAGLFSNASDVLRFAACILAEGRTATGEQLFRPETIRLFATRETQPPGTSRALGWDTPSQSSSSGRFFSPSSIGHLGYAGTSLWIDPDRGLAVVLLTNRTWPDRSNHAIRVIRPAFHDSISAAI